MSSLFSDSKWPLQALGRTYEPKLGKMLRPTPESDADRRVPYLRAGLLDWGLVVSDDLPLMWASEREIVEYEVRVGDLVVAEGGDAGRATILPEIPSNTIMQNSLHRIRGDYVELRFLYYVLSAIHSSGWLEAACNKATIGHLTGEKLRSLPIPAPSPQNRGRVVDFLDREIARIDALGGIKRRLVELLQERWRTEVIQTVTRGFSDKELVPMDSPWFSRLPAEWTLEPLKRRWTVIDCKHHTPVYVDRGFSLVSHAEIEDGRVYPGRSGRFVEEVDYLDLIADRRPKRGDIIYTRNATIGNAGYVDTDQEFAMGQDVCLITSQDQDQRFLTYFLNYVAVDQLAAQRLGATFGRMNVAQIVDLQILCPPPEEQCAIANHLDARRKTYETLSAQLNGQTERLAEHRQALITAAVTGQIDVVAAVA